MPEYAAEYLRTTPDPVVLEPGKTTEIRFGPLTPGPLLVRVVAEGPRALGPGVDPEVVDDPGLPPYRPGGGGFLLAGGPGGYGVVDRPVPLRRPAGGGVERLPLNPEDFRLDVLDDNGNTVATENGQVTYTVPDSGTNGAGSGSFPVFFGRRWTVKITNNSPSRAYIRCLIRFQGIRPVLERDIDLEFLNDKLNVLFNSEQQQPLRLEFVNLPAYEVLGTTIPQSYARLALKPDWARVYPDLHNLKVPLGGKWFKEPTWTEQITLHATVHDGAPAIKLAVKFRERTGRIDLESVIKSQVGTGGGIAVDLYEAFSDVPDIDIDHFDLDLFLVLRPPRDHFGNVTPRFEVVARPYIWTTPDWAGAVAGAGMQFALERLLPGVAARQFAKYAADFQGWLLGDRDRQVIDGRETITLRYIGKPQSDDFTRVPAATQPLNQGDLAKIDHIVVLMLENRSFDHMLGYLSLPRRLSGAARREVLGLTGSETNPKNLRGDVQKVFSLAEKRSRGTVDPRYETRGTRFMLDPGHGFASNAYQRGDKPIPWMVSPFGGLSVPVGQNEGFVLDFTRKFRSEVPLAVQALVFGDVMGYHPAAHVPVYDFLANEFAICDHWFASHPGQTWPNRFVSLTGRLAPDPKTGGPQIENPDLASFDPLEVPTIFDYLTGAGVSWRYYESDFAMLRTFSRYTLDSKNVVRIDDPTHGFFKAASDGKLPSVSYLEANLTDIPPGNDDHPPSDITDGQALVKSVYQALSGGPLWDKTLFIITYDEHGGFYDHVWPQSHDENALYDWTNPAAGGFVPLARHPDDPDRWIDHYGMRVPALIISPWVPRSHVSKMVFDHTAILKTIMARFLDQQPPDMGARVALSPNLGGLLTEPNPRSPGLGPFPGMMLTPNRRFARTLPSRGPEGETDFRAFLGGFARRVRGGH